MKGAIFCVILILLLSCKSEITSSKGIYFSPENLSSLALENINDFWQGDSIAFNSNSTYFFNYYDGFLEGIELRAKNKFIKVDVFKSKEIALNAIEEFRNSISMYTIESNDHKIIKEKWWSMPNSYFAVFVNKYNTIISIYYSPESEEEFTQNIAVEIIRRIGRKCNYLI